MSFVDFGALKQQVPVEQAIPFLGLQMKQHGDQWRGPCPVSKTGGDRALVVTKGKGFYSFGAKQGGDVISFVAFIKGIAAKDAAQLLAAQFFTVPPERSGKENTGNRTITPLTHLEPDHENVAKLGISPETAKHFGGGFTSRGIARGNVLAELRDVKNNLVAYVGLNDPQWLPQDFPAEEHIFGLHLLKEGDAYLASTPLQVLTMHEAGIENVVAFLSPIVSPVQLRFLALNLEERGCQLVT